MQTKIVKYIFSCAKKKIDFDLWSNSLLPSYIFSCAIESLIDFVDLNSYNKFGLKFILGILLKLVRSVGLWTDGEQVRQRNQCKSRFFSKKN